MTTAYFHTAQGSIEAVIVDATEPANRINPRALPASEGNLYFAARRHDAQIVVIARSDAEMAKRYWPSLENEPSFQVVIDPSWSDRRIQAVTHAMAKSLSGPAVSNTTQVFVFAGMDDIDEAESWELSRGRELVSA